MRVSVNSTRAAAIFGLVLICGCASQGIHYKPAFSDEWAEERKHVKEQSQASKKEAWVVAGTEDKPKASVYLDEKGRPKLRLGRDGRVSADIDIDSDSAGGELRYKRPLARPRPKLTAPD